MAKTIVKLISISPRGVHSPNSHLDPTKNPAAQESRRGSASPLRKTRRLDAGGMEGAVGIDDTETEELLLMEGFDLGRHQRRDLAVTNLYDGMRFAPQAVAAGLWPVLLRLAGCVSVGDVRMAAVRGALQPRGEPTNHQHQERRFH